MTAFQTQFSTIGLKIKFLLLMIEYVHTVEILFVHQMTNHKSNKTDLLLFHAHLHRQKYYFHATHRLMIILRVRVNTKAQLALKSEYLQDTVAAQIESHSVNTFVLITLIFHSV